MKPNARKTGGELPCGLGLAVTILDPFSMIELEMGDRHGCLVPLFSSGERQLDVPIGSRSPDLMVGEDR